MFHYNFIENKQTPAQYSMCKIGLLQQVHRRVIRIEIHLILVCAERTFLSNKGLIWEGKIPATPAVQVISPSRGQVDGKRNGRKCRAKASAESS